MPVALLAILARLAQNARVPIGSALPRLAFLAKFWPQITVLKCTCQRGPCPRFQNEGSLPACTRDKSHRENRVQ